MASDETKDEKVDAQDRKKSLPEEKTTISHHSVNLNGELLEYSATTGFQYLLNEEEKPTAAMFFVAYTLDTVEDSLSTFI
jgi:carboxypeptidase C (cathepsin A)